MTATAWRHIAVAIRSPEVRRQVAVRKAAEIALRTGATLDLVHAFSMPYPLPARIPASSGDVLKIFGDHRRKQLNALAKPLRAQGIKVNCHVVWDFPPAEAVVRYCLNHKPDLLVAESQRHSRVGRWFLANTDWELIREVPCPVWFVKHERFPRTLQFLVGVDPTHARSKPTRLDDRLLSATTAAMQQLGGRVAIVHAEDVMQIVPKGFMARVMIPKDAIAAADRARAQARQKINRLLKRHGLSAAAQIVRPGLPADVITEAAANVKADVLVMGVVSRRGLAQSFVGSTAEKVVDTVGCDLLVVKQAGFKTAVPKRGPTLNAVLR